jgi:hypothetical protein
MRAYPVLAGLFVLSTAAIVAHQLVTRPAESATGLLLVAAGLPVYHWWSKRRPGPSGPGSDEPQEEEQA